MKSLIHKSRRREDGVVLIVVLVLLGILTLIVAALVRTGNINFQIAGNQQYRQEARMAAQSAIEAFISSPSNFSAPPLTPTDYFLDLDGDGTNEYKASVPAPTKIGVTRATSSDLATQPASVQTACQPTMNQSGGLTQDSTPTLPPPDTECSYVAWDIAGTVDDSGATGTAVELHQGVRTLVPSTAAEQ